MSDFWWREARSLLCSELIGRGSARKVYACRVDPTLVVKIEKGGRSFQNVSEWEIWDYGYDEFSKWLAPCVQISSCGGILLQKRAEPLRDSDLPERIPAFLTDIKKENFGMLNGRVVCVDYGTMIARVTDASRRLVKARW